MRHTLVSILGEGGSNGGRLSHAILYLRPCSGQFRGCWEFNVDICITSEDSNMRCRLEMATVVIPYCLWIRYRCFASLSTLTALLLLFIPLSLIRSRGSSKTSLLSLPLQWPCPSSSPPPLCSGSSLISVSMRMTAMHASTALFSCRTLLMLGSSTPALT